MENFLKMYEVSDVDCMYGKEVYLTLFPDKTDGYIYKGVLLGYGAYSGDSEFKTFCVNVDRGDGYCFVDFFRDGCFKSKEQYEKFKQRRMKETDKGYTVKKIKEIMKFEEEYIKVIVKVGNMVYPVNGVVEQAKSEMVPAFVLKADVENGKEWLHE